ncbi:MAG TPA: hypothetical protein VJ951_13615 [Bacteroidales bacterium]|nr:hypothetical protein [Bacteroidales bacterium]
MRSTCIAVFCILIVAKSYSQPAAVTDFGPGVVSGKIYTNFHFGLNTPNRETAFEITRAYFGYEKQISKHFSAIVKLDIGSPDDISEFSRVRRYAYFKNAGIEYNSGGLTIKGGIIDMLQFKVQEKFWNYRYLYRSYMDEYRFGPSADLGLSTAYSFNKKLTSDIVLSNGEGYSSPQRDNTFKAGWGVTYMPFENLTIRSYYTSFLTAIPQMTFSLFSGYQLANYRVGGEVIYQKNYKSISNRDRYGYSLYNTYVLNEKVEFFLRYDQLYSNITGNDAIPWNLPNDGSAMVGGIQFSPISRVHITADYQDWYAYARNGEKANILFIHVEVIF